ncbi:hypothetical protein [Paraburkholderia sp. J11-2]|uniref:hypothetical protein n=1 Tax=Paraburkholderia sp. J11-2 TaxID=2805431 RepID=UPI002AB62D53|nr:hypothetical protein [Paraburkholderia sp. J11-2]
MPIEDDSTKLAHGTARASTRPARTPCVREPNSMYRALQMSPLSRLASNGNEQAHVRASAILGHN